MERLTEVEEFTRVRDCSIALPHIDKAALHTKVLDPLYVLLAIVFELPEDYFTKIHRYPVKSEVRRYSSSLRWC
jgi:hypothetical protein